MDTDHDIGPENEFGRTPLHELVAMLDSALAALDDAGEGMAAAHVDMARQVLLAKFG